MKEFSDIAEAAARAAEIIAARSPKNDLYEICKSTPETSATPRKLTIIPSHAVDGICPPDSFTNKAAKIGCNATKAVPAATDVILIAKKNPTKCNASTTPAATAHFTPVLSRECLSANGKVISDPPRFLQKIKVSTGIVLSAINGPDVPIPIMPIPKRIRSGRAGMAV